MPKGTPLWMWNLGIIAVVITIIFWIVFHKNDFISPLKSALALALSCSVFYYALSFGKHSLWFLSLVENGDNIGFWIINGGLMILFIIVQFILSYSIYIEYDEDNLFPSYAPVIIGGSCFIVSLIISNFWVKSFVWIGISILIISQIIQFVMVLKKTNILTAVSILLVSSATIILCIPLMYIMAVVAAILMAKALTGIAVSNSSGEHYVSGSSNQNAAASEEKIFLEDSYGKKVEVELDSSGMNATEKNSMMPRKFRKKDDGSFEEY